MTEDYVSFETAKLLKEKGFDKPCLSHYEVSNKQQYISDSEVKNSDFELEKGKCISAPTLQMTMKWLRKEKGIAIIPIISSILDNEKFLWDIKIVVAKTNETYSQGWIYEEPEEAYDTAIKYVLENLI